MMGNQDYLSEGCDMGLCADLPGKLLREIRPKKSENDYMIVPENFNKKLEQKRGPGHLPSPPPPNKKNQIWILCQNSLTRELKIRVVGFVRKKLLTYFEMLIVPHALQCVDGCFFVFYRIWHSASGILNSNLNSLAKFTYYRGQYKSCSCQNSLTRELKIRVVGFVRKKLLTYFEMLIVPHALQCVDGCFFVFYRIWHSASGILNSNLNSLAKFTYYRGQYKSCRVCA